MMADQITDEAEQADAAPMAPTIQAMLLALLESAEHRGLSQVRLTPESSPIEGWALAHFAQLGVVLGVLETTRKQDQGLL